MMNDQIERMIDALTFRECIAVLAVCAPGVLESVYDDLAKISDPDAAAERARDIVRDVRLKQGDADSLA